MKIRAWILFLIISFAPVSSFAFCGFYVGGAGKKLFNDSTSVILMRDGATTVLSMQNDYKGPMKDFAMVIPVPQVLEKKDVKTLSFDIFEKVDTLAAPRLVQYWERDPCRRRQHYKKSMKGSLGVSDLLSGSVSPVKIKAKFNVDEYEIVILSADDSTALEKWLKDNKYNIPKKAAKYFQPYVQSGMYFFVAKVDIKKVKRLPGGRLQLSPIRFAYQSDNFVLPIRLGLINSRGTQDLLVHVLAKEQRYEVANYPSVMIPTNIELKASAEARFGSFYTSLFNAVLKKNPKAVVTEYSWQAKGCDPCPRKPLTNSDLLSLGGDVIKQKKGGVSFSNFVLTRLHTRYKAGEIGEDLVFKAAPSISGGRENGETGVMESKRNQFQGRYIIRHKWRKKVRCKHPHYKIWGGRGNAKVSSKKSAYIKNKRRAYRKLSKGKFSLVSKLQ